MSTNDFVPFCNNNTGSNLPTQSSYLGNADLPLGNQPGIASSSLNNKALRQGTTIAAALAQFVVDEASVDMLDDYSGTGYAIPPAIAAAMKSALKVLSPVQTVYTSGSGTHNPTYKFQVASANATAGDTYSDGTTTFTVSTTITAGTQLDATGPAAPVVSGTLTLVAGSGDASIAFYAVRAPIKINVRMSGGGGGGSGSLIGSGTAGTTPGTGGTSSFGTSLLTANGGSYGTTSEVGGVGGTYTVSSPATGFGFNGGNGQGGFYSNATTTCRGGDGGSNVFGGAGGGGYELETTSLDASPNTGAGGAGGGLNSTGYGGAGGAAGAYIEANLIPTFSSYSYTVGAGGTGGTAGTSGTRGGNGAAGIIIVEEFYQ